MRSTRSLSPFVLILMILTFGLGLAASAAAQVPSFAQSFNPATIGPGSVSTLRFDITGNGLGVRELAFTNTLPAGLVLASPDNASTSCLNGSVSVSGGDTISLSGGDLPGNLSCSVTVDVIGTATATNVSGDLTSTAGNSGNSTATLTVDINRPGFSKSFATDPIFFGGRSTLTFTIDNSANPAGAGSIQAIDNLPPGMTVASPSNAATDCSNLTVTANSGSNSITLSPLAFGFENVAANSTCTVSVDVVGNAIGILGNTTGDLTSTPVPFGTTRSSGKAADTLTVTIEQISLTKEFIDDPANPGGTVTLRFTIRSLDRRNGATNISFTDDLDAVLSGLVASSLPANPCGAGSSVSGSGFLTFSNGSLGVEESCTFDVTLSVPAGAAGGVYTNTTSAITADIGGEGAVGDPATDQLFVATGPLLTAEFIDDPVGAGDTVTLRYTLTNTSATLGATDIAFEHEYPTALPTAVSVPANGFCGGSSTAVFTPLFNPPPPSSVTPAKLVISGAALDQGASCSFDIVLDVEVSTATNTYPTTTGSVSATVGGEPATGNPASASLEVVAAPQLSKEFIDDPAPAGGTVTLQFTLAHDFNAPGDATNITFSDDLTGTLSGLVASGLPAVGVCGEGSQIDGTTSLLFSGGTLAPGESCTFSVTLDVPAGAVPGSYSNTTSNVMADVLGVTATNSAASDDLRIAGLTLTKEFTDDPVRPGNPVNLRYTITNSSATLGATAITFNDDFNGVISGLAAPGLPLADVCGVGSSVIGLSGNRFLVFVGGTLGAGESCTFDVSLDVPSNAAGNDYVSTTGGFSANIDGSVVVFDNASDVLTVAGESVLFSKSFLEESVAPGGFVDLAFTITNVDSKTVTDLSFTDDLGAALPGLASVSGTVADVCGAGSQISGTSVLTLTGGSLAMGESCTFSVTLAVPASAIPGTIVVNTTSEVTGLVIGFVGVVGEPATDSMIIDFLEFSKAFASEVQAGDTVALTFTIRNLSTTDPANDLSFADDLDAVLSGLVATGLPAANVCGVGSSLTGTSFLTMTGGNLLPGGSCTFSVDVVVPAGAEPGDYLNITSDLRLGENVEVAPATATLTVAEPPDSDEDGVSDDVDNCPVDPNPDQADGDEDGVGDVCDLCPNDAGNDSDGDGVCESDGDCNDNDPSVNPGAEEVCDGVDNNCDTQIDEGFDQDEDGVADCFDVCPADAGNDSDGDGVCESDGDCNDNDPSVNPGAEEVCDGVDNNCDTQIDEGFDQDEDGIADCFDVCPADAGNDADGDQFCASEGDCNDNDAGINPGAAEVCDGIDNNCDTQVDEGFDADSDGVADCFDVCPLDAGNDADGDQFCASEGDCNDNDAGINPDAEEICDNIDQNCDGEINIGADCGSECGNGVLDANPLPAPACPNPNQSTDIRTRAEFDAWAADPTTSAKVKEDIDFGGDDIVVSTLCDFDTLQGDDLTGVGNAYIAARDIDINGDIVASGEVALRASNDVTLRQGAGPFTGFSLSVEGADIEYKADNDQMLALCVEGGEVNNNQSSNTTMANGPVLFVGDFLDIHGDFTGASSFSAISFGNLEFRQSSKLTVGDATLEAIGELDLHGDIEATGVVSVTGEPLIFRQSCQISGAGGVTVTGSGAETLDWHGKVVDSGDVTVNVGGGLLVLRQNGRIETNGDVNVDVLEFEGRGRIRFNGDVVIDADTYELFNSHNFRDNNSCTITGTALPGSRDPNGCVAQ